MEVQALSGAPPGAPRERRPYYRSSSAVITCAVISIQPKTALRRLDETAAVLTLCRVPAPSVVAIGMDRVSLRGARVRRLRSVAATAEPRRQRGRTRPRTQRPAPRHEARRSGRLDPTSPGGLLTG